MALADLVDGDLADLVALADAVVAPVDPVAVDPAVRVAVTDATRARTCTKT